ncbi:MAG: CHAD domain-containing protein [Terracidiphilus sp.]
MSFGIHPEAALSGPGVQEEFRRQIRAWSELLARCARKPGQKSVHRLRVATLRLQAALEFSLSCMNAGSSSAKPAERWLRQGKKLRRALGPVRQADVSLGKLASIKGCAEHAPTAPAVFPKEYSGAIEKLERTITRRRGAAAKKLVVEIEQRRKRLTRLSRKLETDPACFLATAQTGVADTIQSQMIAAAAGFSTLTIENLHEFRKRIKKIRYLAEVFAPLDPAAARQASMLKRMTAAAGEWHDWQALAEEAARADRKNTGAEAAAEFARAQARRSFEHARTLCTRSIARMLKGAEEDRGRRGTSARKPDGQAQRKPVVSVSPVPNSTPAERSVHASNLAS